jgi:hypothetical protein
MTAHPDVGKLLFGRSLRLEFGEWVHARGGEPFYVSEVQNALDTSPSGVHEELRRFTRLGMLDRMPKGGDRRQYYRKTGHPLWNVFATTRSVSGDRLINWIDPGSPGAPDMSRPDAVAIPMTPDAPSPTRLAARPTSTDPGADNETVTTQRAEPAAATTRDGESVIDEDREPLRGVEGTATLVVQPTMPPVPDVPDGVQNASDTTSPAMTAETSRRGRAPDADVHRDAATEAGALAKRRTLRPSPQPASRTLGDLLDDESWRRKRDTTPSTNAAPFTAWWSDSAVLEPADDDGPVDLDDATADAAADPTEAPFDDSEWRSDDALPWWSRDVGDDDANGRDPSPPWSGSRSTSPWRPLSR